MASPAAFSNVHVTPSRRYLLISPCRDEAQYLRRTLDSVAAQSVPPALWVVVDDGSTDDTPTILEAYARRLRYLRVVRRADRGQRQVGPGVIAAFYTGLETVRLEDFDYVCKLDMDLDLPVRYFELLMQRMESDPRIGTTSGKPWFVHPQSGALVPEVCGDEMSVGMTKFYRVACFKEIGGFVHQVMWDGIDCHRARMLGWIAESVDLEPLRFVHLRPQGASHKGIWTGRLRTGSANTSWARRRCTTWRWPSITCRLTRCSSGAWPCCGATSGAGSRAYRATTTSSSGASFAPTSTPACAWASGPPRPGSTPSEPSFGMPRTRLPGPNHASMKRVGEVNVIVFPETGDALITRS